MVNVSDQQRRKKLAAYILAQWYQQTSFKIDDAAVASGYEHATVAKLIPPCVGIISVGGLHGNHFFDESFAPENLIEPLGISSRDLEIISNEAGLTSESKLKRVL